MHKLQLYGIKGKCLNGFKSYLKHLQQLVSLDKYENSICRKITCSVTQGSILRPILFLIYINDFFRSSNKVTPIMFTNDTNLFISNFNIENLFQTMDEELRKVANWFKANKLSLNISKTKYSLFHSTRKRKDILNILFDNIDNVPVKIEFVIKFPAVYLDENIFWKHHINIVSTKTCKNIGILCRTRCILSKFLLKQLYFSFINCYLNYVNIAWASANISKLQALYRHQKHATRVINFKDKFTSAKPLLKQINVMTVHEMNIFQTLYFMYLCKNGSTPSIFKHIYTLKPINKYKTRSKNILFNNYVRKTLQNLS